MMSEMKLLGHSIQEYMEVLWLAVFDAAADFPTVVQGLHRLQKALHIAKIAAQRLSKYLGSIRVADDTKMAMAIGVVVGVATIALLAYYPGNDYDTSGSKESDEKSLRKKGKKQKNREPERSRCSDLSGDVTDMASERETEVLSNEDLGDGTTGRVDQKAAVFLKGLASIKDEIMETRKNGAEFNSATPQNGKGLRKRGKSGKSKVVDGSENVQGENTARDASSSEFKEDEDSSSDDEGKEGIPSNPFDNPVVRVYIHFLVSMYSCTFVYLYLPFQLFHACFICCH